MQPSKTFVPDPLLNLPLLKFIPTVWEGEEVDVKQSPVPVVDSLSPDDDK
jgi:hypothetical protein